MLPYQTLIAVDRQSSVAVYLQITNAVILHIKKGVIQPGTRLPGTRSLALQLQVHRKTVVRAFEELEAQGWIIHQASRGTFVRTELPENRPQKVREEPLTGNVYPNQTGFQLPKNEVLCRPVVKAEKMPGFDDGFPDVRQAPVDILGRAYRSLLKRSFQKDLISYGDPLGNAYLRQVLASYLQQSRGLAISADNICITRGSVMGIYLTVRLVCKPGDTVLVGDTNYLAANMIVRNAGCVLHRIPVDDQGISVDAIAAFCQTQPVRLIYVTSHHHYPTTVTLSAERRIRLLQLADEYGFAILEDDYDYDYHYASSPILPLASADTNGMVVYVGSLSKMVAPAFRVGYLVAPQNLIEEAGYLRRIIDRQGDTILEQAIAELITEGELKRHIKKAQRLYHQRRDALCELLHTHLGDKLQFQVPTGGMALWTQFPTDLPLPTLAAKARQQGLLLGSGTNYDNDTLNATRMGFASRTPDELEQAVLLLKKVLVTN